MEEKGQREREKERGGKVELRLEAEDQISLPGQGGSGSDLSLKGTGETVIAHMRAERHKPGTQVLHLSTWKKALGWVPS